MEVQWVDVALAPRSRPELSDEERKAAKRRQAFLRQAMLLEGATPSPSAQRQFIETEIGPVPRWTPPPRVPLLLLSDGNVPRVVSIVGIALCGLFYLLVVSA